MNMASSNMPNLFVNDELVLALDNKIRNKVENIQDLFNQAKAMFPQRQNIAIDFARWCLYRRKNPLLGARAFFTKEIKGIQQLFEHTDYSGEKQELYGLILEGNIKLTDYGSWLKYTKYLLEHPDQGSDDLRLEVILSLPKLVIVPSTSSQRSPSSSSPPGVSQKEEVPAESTRKYVEKALEELDEGIKVLEKDIKGSRLREKGSFGSLIQRLKGNMNKVTVSMKNGDYSCSNFKLPLKRIMQDLVSHQHNPIVLTIASIVLPYLQAVMEDGKEDMVCEHTLMCAYAR